MPAPVTSESNLAREVTRCRDLPHDIGDGGKGAGDGPRHGEAEQSGHGHRDDGGDGEFGVKCAEKSKVLGARAQNHGDRSGAGRIDGVFAREQLRQRDVLLAAERHVGRLHRSVGAPEKAGERGPVLRAERSCHNPAVDAERDLTAGDLFELGCQSIVESEPHAQGPENVGVREADRNGDGHELQDTVRLCQQTEALPPVQGSADRGMVGDHRRIERRGVERRQHLSLSVRDEEQAGLQLVLIHARDVLHGRWIVGVDGCLEPWSVGDEPCHRREAVGAGRAQLLDDCTRRDNLALQRALELGSHPHAHEVDRHADRQQGEERAGQEDPAAERRQSRHRKEKSSSVVPSDETVTVSGLDRTPSCHARTVYVPGGMLSRR